MSTNSQHFLDLEAAARDQMRNTVVDECAQRLAACGAKFAIRFDGRELGDLKVAADQAKKPRKRIHDWREKTAPIGRLTVGGACSIWCKEDEDLSAFSGACSATAHKLFGSRNYKTTTNTAERIVTIMRFA